MGDEQGIIALIEYREHLDFCAALSQFEADNTTHEAFNQKLVSQLILRTIKLVHRVYLVKQNLHEKLIFSPIGSKEPLVHLVPLTSERQ